MNFPSYYSTITPLFLNFPKDYLSFGYHICQQLYLKKVQTLSEEKLNAEGPTKRVIPIEILVCMTANSPELKDKFNLKYSNSKTQSVDSKDCALEPTFL